MMKDYYRLSFPITSTARKISQKILLLAAIVLDLSNVFVIINIIFDNLNYLFMLAGFIAISTIMRIIATKLNYSYEYQLINDNFRINKVYSLKTHNIISLNSDTLFAIEDWDNVQVLPRENILTSECCDMKNYILRVNNKDYLISLDEYMYALIYNLPKEKKNDLS